MGFNINEEITTKLHYKDIALIAAALGVYKESYSDNMDDEQKNRVDRLVDRLGSEMYNCPDDEPNGH